MFLFTVLDCDQFNQVEAGLTKFSRLRRFLCSSIVHTDFASDPKLED